MKVLVGHTGFVGSNLSESTSFDYCFNSKNIADSFGLNPELLVYSGVRAEKFLANKEPAKDFDIILNAIETIKKINPKKIVLISTIDVYPNPVDVNEDSEINYDAVQPYGRNRLYLEKWVEANFTEYLIVRLPGLFGKNIKKNFIFDLISVIPSMLNADLYQKLAVNNWIEANYSLQENGFYKLKDIGESERKELKKRFLELGFSALNFTDSRGKFQFYNLKNLWNDIQIALQSDVRKLNLATAPIEVGEIYHAFYGEPFHNELSNPVPNYDFHTIHASLFGKDGNYIGSKEEVLNDIINFIKEATH
ncbi:MAG TPA: NAD-dependent epimerase/dehydratase family protein [Flavobacterium sp.]|uniref:NAD-dependent epimerase/dehydratase family protein n=1 Tax=Flavobacterium sp. TaxID=239 RepID=UPI002C3410FC|nr:NAD-dependent epimerase/dehydratase family protein [Flavobacterium sp.]HSD14312.1 NAD-dependent epimerase/dehydratase family protein [Flavobacterium sp.]